MKYQLPCKCGLSVEIEPGQAGQVVVCSCGEKLLVPTMLQIKALPMVPEKSPAPREETGILRRTFFILGVVLLVPSLYFAVYLYLNVPHPSGVSLKRVQFSFGSNKRALIQDSTPIPWQEHQILWMTDEIIDNMMPMELFFYFQTLKEPMFSHNFLDNYDAIKDTYRIRVTATMILLVLAVLSIVASFFMPKRQTLVTGWSGNEWR